MSGRYHVRFTKGFSRQWDDMTMAGETDDMGEALTIMRQCFADGVTYACQRDMRPDEPRPVSEAEREALALIAPKMPRTMEA